jgi:flagellar hook protein FlgE
MNTLSSIALSGINAAQTRLNASANNIANLSTDGFRRDEVSAQAVEGGGVSTTVGKAAQAGSDLVQDIVDQKMAAFEFKANVQVLKTSAQVMGTLLDEKA